MSTETKRRVAICPHCKGDVSIITVKLDGAYVSECYPCGCRFDSHMQLISSRASCADGTQEQARLRMQRRKRTPVNPEPWWSK